MSVDVIAFGAHPDDLEVSMGGTAVKLAAAGLRILFVDLTDGEPARYAARGIRRQQAMRAAEILGVQRLMLNEQDRLLQDSVPVRLLVAQLIRTHRPRFVFAPQGEGVHPDHRALTDIVINGVFYARLPKWGDVEGGELLRGTDPHEIERLFFSRCRMERPWSQFDFSVDVTGVYQKKLEAIAAYRSERGPHSLLIHRWHSNGSGLGSHEEI
jgi:N-acetylglucosamine malate deacetylase 1